MARSLVLTGFMATGKSAVARALARRLGWRQIDCDAEIVARAGKSIPEIFRTAGEAHFRVLEREVISALADDHCRCPQCGQRRPAVIATGGGAIVDLRNYAQLSRAGIVVCLTARPEVIVRRIGGSAKARPMLTEGGKPVKQRIIELMEHRQAAYARAVLTIDTSDLTIEEVVERILATVGERRATLCQPST
jgi:shikimate kinase